MELCREGKFSDRLRKDTQSQTSAHHLTTNGSSLDCSRLLICLQLPPLAPRKDEVVVLNSNVQLHLLRQAVLLSHANVVLADSDLLQVLDCSPAAHERLGTSREEDLALAPLGLQGEPEHDAAWLKRQVALLHRQGQHSVQTRDRSSDGACADLMVQLQLVACGSRQLALVTLHESSDRRAQPGQAERLNKLLLDA
jgi:PAS domain-containing protein